ncbi:MAG: Bug family tripartite tricarboxylate transporter substrate binding protein, partial [bacterium]
LHAQRAQPIAFPEKPMRMIVPFPPGGGNDIVGRAVAQRLSEVVGQQVVVDNRPGAGGVVGVTIAAQSVPDGYTMLLGSVGMLAHNPALKRDLAYSPLRDFAPVALLVTSPMIIAVNPGLPVKTVAELIALAKASPGKLSYASGGTGSSLHMTGELFLRATGTNMLHVPYKGGGPALVDLVGGRVDLIFSTMPPALSLVKSGKLRAVAVPPPWRAPALPEVPTVGETVKGFEVTNWQGIVVPSKTPQAIVRKLHADLAATMKLPAMGETMAQQGQDTAIGTPEQFGALIRSEIETYTQLVRAAGIKAD